MGGSADWLVAPLPMPCAAESGMPVCADHYAASADELQEKSTSMDHFVRG